MQLNQRTEDQIYKVVESLTEKIITDIDMSCNEENLIREILANSLQEFNRFNNRDRQAPSLTPVIEDTIINLTQACIKSAMPDYGPYEHISSDIAAKLKSYMCLWIDESRKFVIYKNTLTGCMDKSKEIKIPHDVEIIGTGAFENNTTIEGVSLLCSEGLELREIYPYAFSGCVNLKNVEYLELANKCGYIRHDAFRDCSSLKTILLPPHVREIEECAFYGCKTLETLSIPEGALGIERWAFKECPNLKFIYIPDSVDFISDEAFDENSKVVICCSKGSYAEGFANTQGFDVISSLSDYIARSEEFEIPVHDKVYEMESYFYKPDENSDSPFVESNHLLASALQVKYVDPDYKGGLYTAGVTVNLSELIQKNIDALKREDLFISYDIDDIMNDMESILSGNVSEKWMHDFVKALTQTDESLEQKKNKNSMTKE